MIAIEAVEHLGGRLNGAQIEQGSQNFALVPGGTVALGFALDDWQPTAEQAADQESPGGSASPNRSHSTWSRSVLSDTRSRPRKASDCAASTDAVSARFTRIPTFPQGTNAHRVADPTAPVN
ncbi:hypothetical protein [Streptomyces sp. NPDC020362]|uniref:hypothetical protein n=1 Tax=unclassified Streptomyces TaxID=2593676 RepID=UPI0033DBB22E